MSEQKDHPSSSLNPPVSKNSSSNSQVVDQPWRIEAEISIDRQNELAQYRAITPDIAQGIYPDEIYGIERIKHAKPTPIPASF